MTKTLDAECALGIVRVDGKPVIGCDILSEGVGSSSGKVFIDEEKTVYVGKTTADLKDLLTSLSGCIDQITGCFNALDGLPTVSGACASYTAQLLLIKVQLELLKVQLK